MNPVLLLVDDDEAIRTQMKWTLSADYEIISAEDREFLTNEDRCVALRNA